jgi:hypothetical protein
MTCQVSGIIEIAVAIPLTQRNDTKKIPATNQKPHRYPSSLSSYPMPTMHPSRCTQRQTCIHSCSNPTPCQSCSPSKWMCAGNSLSLFHIHNVTNHISIQIGKHALQCLNHVFVFHPTDPCRLLRFRTSLPCRRLFRREPSSTAPVRPLLGAWLVPPPTDGSEQRVVVVGGMRRVSRRVSRLRRQCGP